MRSLLLMACLVTSIQAPAQLRLLEAEPNHSTVGFGIDIAGFTRVTGKFTDFTIYLTWNPEDHTVSDIDVEIRVASINTGIPDRDKHLATDDFFDADNYPIITFTSESVNSSSANTFEATGQLTMHGVTQNIVLPFAITRVDGNAVGFHSRYTLNRIDYGVGADFVHSAIPDFLSDDVDVEIDFWTRKRKK